ncbi:TRAP transporter large permease subunit [Acuticoccus sp. M5D2P5]|uniref:TRAP transporter large permease n=1 Tax=Acuticoccus kalidii TaxID=2910977 RepID=UPI001F2A9D40|nr:TRAP transporter large permease subunit [Acuticoccus kalidii]MCF3934805.1 TRAP transporter large permease subunit [Acuticoccus kalidii]
MPDFALSFALFFGLLLAMIGVGLWLFVAIFLIGIGALYFDAGYSLMRIGLLLQTTTWSAARAWELSAIPLFIWMGELLIRSNIASAVFEAIAPITRRIPGGLVHANVLGSTLFASVSGSTAATTATIGRITLPALKEQNYPRRLSLGSMAASGSIGILVPPSIPLIVYGVLAQVSIGDLFLAGLLPGLMVAALFMTYIAAISLIRGTDKAVTPPETLRSGARRVLDIMPLAAIILAVIGGIYTGLATPSEAAALGLGATLILIAFRGQISVRLLRETLQGTVRVSCMIGILLVASGFLSSAMSLLHIPQQAGAAIAALELSPMTLIFILTVFYLLLGCVLDGVSMMVMTLPITAPMAIAAGFDPIWLGVYFVLTMELGLITPPIGFNLFILRGITGETISKIALAAIPFFLLLCLAVALLTVFPQIALFLPSLS